MKSTVASLWTSAVRSIRSATASARKRAAAWTLPRSFIAGFRNVLDALRPDERQQSERFVPQRAASLVCAGLVFAAGVIMVGIESRWSKILTRASYDWSFGLGHLTQRVPKELNTVIVYVDANSLAELGQSSSEPMDRSLHARLLRRLKADGARTVVMDIVFSELGPHHEADEDL